MRIKFLLTVSLLLMNTILLAQDGDNEIRQTVINNGIGLGGAIAVAISWSRNKSILWAIIHGILSWLYVIYYFIIRDNKDKSRA
ncbi:MAG TPA: hypothetical protein VGD26_11590 [Chitinophagaceae bacterium]